MSLPLCGSETGTDVKDGDALHLVQLWRLLQGLFWTNSYLLRPGQFLLMVPPLNIVFFLEDTHVRSGDGFSPLIWTTPA